MNLAKVEKIISDESINSLKIGPDVVLRKQLVSQLDTVLQKVLNFKKEWKTLFSEELDVKKFKENQDDLDSFIKDQFIIENKIHLQQKHFKIEALREMVNFPDFGSLIVAFEKLQNCIYNSEKLLSVVPIELIMKTDEEGYPSEIMDLIEEDCKIEVSGRDQVLNYCGIWLFRTGFSMFSNRMGMSLNSAAGYINRNNLLELMERKEIIPHLKTRL